MIRRGGGISALGEVLSGYTRRRNWQRQLGLNQVFLFWEEVLAPEITAHARPMVIKGDTLWLEVSDPVWSQQLQFETRTILQCLNGRLAALSDGECDNLQLRNIRFKLCHGPWRVAAEPKESPPPPGPVDAARQAEFNQLTAGIEDKDLRKTLRRLWLIMELGNMRRKVEAG
ncbi:DciA family protein [Desulfobacterota bacterium M19]